MSDDLDDLEALIGPMPTKHRRRLRHLGETEAHCRRGHAMTPDNIYTSPDGRYHRCKKCQRLRILCREDS